MINCLIMVIIIIVLHLKYMYLSYNPNPNNLTHQYPKMDTPNGLLGAGSKIYGTCKENNWKYRNRHARPKQCRPKWNTNCHPSSIILETYTDIGTCSLQRPL